MTLINLFNQINQNPTVETVASIIIVLYTLAAFGLIVYGYNCYYYLYIFLKNKKSRVNQDKKAIRDFFKKIKEENLPIVTTQLPVFNEKNVVERLIAYTVQQNYPKDKHEIQVLDDSTDETKEIIAKQVKHYQKLGYDIQHIHRDQRTDYKAGALKNGMANCRGKYIAIFDADFTPHPEFIRSCIPFMENDKKIGMVQTRWGHINDKQSLLTRTQAIGIDGHFIVEQSARSWGKLFLNFNGTAGMWRKETIIDSGNWQGDTVTEDMDLSYRAQLKDWKTKFIHHVICQAELPDNIHAFKSQQYRWAKGSIQTAIKIIPRLLKSQYSWKIKMQSILHLTHYCIHPLIIFIALFSLPFIFQISHVFSPIFFYLLYLLLFGAMLAPNSLYLVSQKDYPDFKRRIFLIPYLACIGIGLAVNNTSAVLSALYSKNREFIRTPKTGNASSEDIQIKNKKKYKVKIKKTFIFEILLSIYCFASLTVYLQSENFFISPFLFLYSISFLTIFIYSFSHSLKYMVQSK